MTASIASLPAPSVSARQSREPWTGKLARIVKTEYLLESGTNDKGEKTEVIAQVTTSHSGERKQYVTSLTRLFRTHSAPFQSDYFAPMSDSVIVTREACARYSEKGLRAAHDHGLQRLAEVFDSETVQDLFDPSQADHR